MYSCTPLLPVGDSKYLSYKKKFQRNMFSPTIAMTLFALLILTVGLLDSLQIQKNFLASLTDGKHFLVEKVDETNEVGTDVNWRV